MAFPFYYRTFCQFRRALPLLANVSGNISEYPTGAKGQFFEVIQLLYNVYIMSESSVLTLRLDAKLKNQLDRLSKAMSRSRSFVAAQAIQEFVTLNEWQIGEIKKAIAEADRGDFASDEQVRQSLKRWTRRAR